VFGFNVSLSVDFSNVLYPVLIFAVSNKNAEDRMFDLALWCSDERLYTTTISDDGGMIRYGVRWMIIARANAAVDDYTAFWFAPVSSPLTDVFKQSEGVISTTRDFALSWQGMNVEAGAERNVRTIIGMGWPGEGETPQFTKPGSHPDVGAIVMTSMSVAGLVGVALYTYLFCFCV
jgi:hypothetical protein